MLAIVLNTHQKAALAWLELDSTTINDDDEWAFADLKAVLFWNLECPVLYLPDDRDGVNRVVGALYQVTSNLANLAGPVAGVPPSLRRRCKRYASAMRELLKAVSAEHRVRYPEDIAPGTPVTADGTCGCGTCSEG